MNVELKLTDRQDAYVVQNLWPLYRHDVSEFDASFVANRHGLFDCGDRLPTLAEHTQHETARWWTDPAALFPYLILVDGRPAGFNLVAARSSLPAGIDADFVVHEFFVLHAHRGRKVAERAAVLGFDAHPGSWEVVTWPTHTRAIHFWRRTVSGYAAGEYREDEVDHPWGRRVAFRFESRGGQDA
ncbi:hypothetical protein KOR34_42890 [Posidoniimonas corsicana]|uniref:N-acetyltransferase domain-containing protein n=1 Tax=Posidoniimonas corsicana TaxID=1938618 RepID=A0A5C5V1S5_9BACT|nr:GNAT family N-acetyltransferase [Posidoniimonas corsicana]TWT32526.1 hypothetical protein KOR34_42890 [Posidoniimonas corsicana]